MKPIIIYIEDEFDMFGDRNQKRDSLCYFLRSHYNCEVFSYINEIYFQEDKFRLEKYAKRILLAIVKERLRCQELIKNIRNFCASFPIIVIPDPDFREANNIANQTFVRFFNYTDPNLLKYIEGLVLEQRQSSLDWLGSDSGEDMFAQLEKAHENYFSPDYMLDVPTDYNHHAVAQALRIKLLQDPVLVKTEFEDTFVCHKKKQTNNYSTSHIYSEEKRRISNLTREEKSDLFDSFQETMGYTKEGLRTRASFGDQVGSFAIDPITLEKSIFNGGIGHHDAKEQLVKKIIMIECYSRGVQYLGWEEEMKCSSRIVKGLVFYGILDFHTPFLVLMDYDSIEKDVLKKIIPIIENELKLIVVSFYGELIVG